MYLFMYILSIYSRSVLIVVFPLLHWMVRGGGVNREWGGVLRSLFLCFVAGFLRGLVCSFLCLLSVDFCSNAFVSCFVFCNAGESIFQAQEGFSCTSLHLMHICLFLRFISVCNFLFMREVIKQINETNIWAWVCY